MPTPQFGQYFVEVISGGASLISSRGLNGSQESEREEKGLTSIDLGAQIACVSLLSSACKLLIQYDNNDF